MFFDLKWKDVIVLKYKQKSKDNILAQAVKIKLSLKSFTKFSERGILKLAQ